MLRTLLIMLALMLSACNSDAYYAVRYREHATDCTAVTDGKKYDYCFEIDANDIYKCVPASGDCDTPAEWQRIGNYTTIQMHVVDYVTNVTTGDGKMYFYIPLRLNGLKLFSAHAQVIAAGTTGLTTVQIARCANAATGNACSGAVNDMLSTRITIDSGEDSSDSAATPPVVNATYATVSQYQVLRVDVDTVSTTPPKGLIVTLAFVKN